MNLWRLRILLECFWWHILWYSTAIWLGSLLADEKVEGIDLIHKSHNAPVSYPTMHNSEQQCAPFCFEGCIVGYGAVHCGICEIGQLRHFFGKFVIQVYSGRV